MTLIQNANIKKAKEGDTDFFKIKVATEIPKPELILKDFFNTIKEYAVNKTEKIPVSIFVENK